MAPQPVDMEEVLTGLLFAVSQGNLSDSLRIAERCTLPEVLDWFGRMVEARRGYPE